MKKATIFLCVLLCLFMLSCIKDQINSVQLIGQITQIKSINIVDGSVWSLCCLFEIDNEFDVVAIISDCSNRIKFDFYVYPNQYLYFYSTTNIDGMCNLPTPYGTGTFFVSANKNLENLK